MSMQASRSCSCLSKGKKCVMTRACDAVMRGKIHRTLSAHSL
jgi:hypothetical protein